ncbi:hypothetical protein REPUB_Repub01dG0176500 [Reevesia pubescens]
MRDDSGAVKLVFSNTIGSVDSTVAELLAIKEALVIFVASKWVKTHCLCIESDNQSVVKWVSCPKDTPWKLRKSMSTVEAVKLELINWEVSFTPRVNNVMVDDLAKSWGWNAADSREILGDEQGYGNDSIV